MPPLSSVGTSMASDGAYSSLSLISISEALTSWLISADTVSPVTGPQIRSGSCAEPCTIWPPGFGCCALAPGAMVARARIDEGDGERTRLHAWASVGNGGRTVTHRPRGVQRALFRERTTSRRGGGTGPAPYRAGRPLHRCPCSGRLDGPIPRPRPDSARSGTPAPACELTGSRRSSSDDGIPGRRPHPVRSGQRRIGLSRRRAAPVGYNAPVAEPPVPDHLHEDPNAGLVFRRGKLRKREDDEVRMMREALANLADVLPREAHPSGGAGPLLQPGHQRHRCSVQRSSAPWSPG